MFGGHLVERKSRNYAGLKEFKITGYQCLSIITNTGMMILNAREINDYESIRIRIRTDNTFNTLNKATFETLRLFTNGKQMKKGVCHECEEISTLI